MKTYIHLYHPDQLISKSVELGSSEHYRLQSVGWKPILDYEEIEDGDFDESDIYFDDYDDDELL